MNLASCLQTPGLSMEKEKKCGLFPVGHIIGNILYCARFLVTNPVFGKAGTALQPLYYRLLQNGK